MKLKLILISLIIFIAIFVAFCSEGSNDNNEINKENISTDNNTTSDANSDMKIANIQELLEKMQNANNIDAFFESIISYPPKNEVEKLTVKLLLEDLPKRIDIHKSNVPKPVISKNKTIHNKKESIENTTACAITVGTNIFKYIDDNSKKINDSDIVDDFMKDIENIYKESLLNCK